MGLHKSYHRGFYLLGGNVMKEGWSLNLAKGQLGIFDTEDGLTSKGMKAVSSFRGKPKDRLFEIRCGNGNSTIKQSRTGNTKSDSSVPFSLSNVLGLKVTTPQITEQQVDEVILGYNGINPSTSFKFRLGETKKILVRLSGEPIGQLGYKQNYVDIPLYLDTAYRGKPFGECEEYDICKGVDCIPVIQEAIETLKNHQLMGGVPVKHFIDVLPVRECTTKKDVTVLPYDFYDMSTCDTGDGNALAIVQAQYPNDTVVRVKRVGAVSHYQILLSRDEGKPTDYIPKIAGVIGGCAECPPNYTAVPGGYIYAITVEDLGENISSDMEVEMGGVVGTMIKYDGQDGGTGYYTVMSEKEVNFYFFENFAAKHKTATLDKVGKAKDFCEGYEGEGIKWNKTGTCGVVEEVYTLDLPDDKCGNDRLVELQESYPSLEIELEGTAAGCQHRYKTTVISNLVCDECDDIFKDYYITEAPATFEDRKWKLFVKEVVVVPPVEGEEEEVCLCGIRLIGKKMEIQSDECLRDQVGFVDSSVQIEASGGYITEVREGIGSIKDEEYNVEYITRWAPRTQMGGNLQEFEDQNRAYFTGQPVHSGNYLAKVYLNEESVLNPGTQYMNYSLLVRRPLSDITFGQRSETYFTYQITVEVGRHQDVEDLLNSIASQAGAGVVKAFG